MKKTTPRSEYGYYCDLCNKKICKYSLDWNNTGAISVDIGKDVANNKDICYECSKLITEEVVSNI